MLNLQMLSNNKKLPSIIHKTLHKLLVFSRYFNCTVFGNLSCDYVNLLHVIFVIIKLLYLYSWVTEFYLFCTRVISYFAAIIYNSFLVHPVTKHADWPSWLHWIFINAYQKFRLSLPLSGPYAAMMQRGGRIRR